MFMHAYCQIAVSCKSMVSKKTLLFLTTKSNGLIVLPIDNFTQFSFYQAINVSYQLSLLSTLRYLDELFVAKHILCRKNKRNTVIPRCNMKSIKKPHCSSYLLITTSLFSNSLNERGFCVLCIKVRMCCGLCIKALINIIMNASKAIKLCDFDQVYCQTVLTAGTMRKILQLLNI